MDTTMESRSLYLDYQPVVRISDGGLVGFESLSRFRTGDVTVMPDEFMPEIIGGGDLGELTTTLLHRAPVEVSEVFPDTPVAINVSVLQITDDEWLEAALDIDFGVPRQSVVWEITESEPAPEKAVAAAVEQIRVAGFTTAMDDFDSGFSSLARLASAPFDALKLDRALVRDVGFSRRHRIAVETVVDLAAKLDAKVVAEGIESTAQAQIISELGVEYGQGWLYGRPGPIERFTDLRFPVAA